MSRLKIGVLIGLLLALASGGGWFALRFSQRPAESAPKVSAKPPAPAASSDTAAAEALHSILSAKAGQVTAGDIAKQRDLLLNRSPESRSALERGLQSEDPFERLLAFRLLLDLDGWTPPLSDRALRDSFVLLRVEAADWLYLTRRFQEWDAFLSAAAPNALADYAALKPSVQHLAWGGFLAGLELLGAGHGIDRYFREIIRHSDAVASVAAGDVHSTAVPPEQQLALLRLLHAANRPDFETLLQNMLSRTSDDTPVRYEGIWMLGQRFASITNRDLLVQHVPPNTTDPLQPRVEQALVNVNRQIALGGDRLAWFEARLSVALKSGTRAEQSSALIALLDEALLFSRVADTAPLQEVRRALPTEGLDYTRRRRLADIDFLIVRSQ